MLKLTPPEHHTNCPLLPSHCDYTIDKEKIHKTAILVPVGSHIEPTCDESLRTLERNGIKVFRKYGFSAIDQGRCVMAQVAIDNGYEHLFWIDSDMSFYPYDIHKVLNYNLPMVTGAYSIKGWPALTTKFFNQHVDIPFGTKGKLYPVEYAATGFMYTHIDVYQKIATKFDMTPVKIWGGQYTVHPWFFPAIIGDEYVGEDFAFCYRARQSGVAIYCDTSLQLAHIGRYEYGFKFLNTKPASEISDFTYSNQVD